MKILFTVRQAKLSTMLASGTPMQIDNRGNPAGVTLKACARKEFQHQRFAGYARDTKSSYLGCERAAREWQAKRK
jgi:hypothetical protein